MEMSFEITNHSSRGYFRAPQKEVFGPFKGSSLGINLFVPPCRGVPACIKMIDTKDYSWPGGRSEYHFKLS